MAEDATPSRPLSPHLQVYRWPATMLTSIAHRATGIALYAGTLFLTWWLIAAATGPDAYAAFQNIAGLWIGKLVLIGFSWSLIYHLLNGIRHLHWDAGLGFDKERAERSSWIVIGASVLLTLIIWLLA